MIQSHSTRALVAAALFCAFAATLVPAQTQPKSTPANAPAQPATQPPASQPVDPPAPKERAEAIKKSFAESQAKLRGYEWIETTVLTLKGEEKSRKQNRCYYGAEGKLQKVPLAAPDKPATGIGHRIKEKKKEELADYMEDAAALLHNYLPPDPVKIQKCTEGGMTTIHILEPGKRAKVQFVNYLQAGDSLAVEIDLTNNTILGLSVASALGKDKDPVTLEVKFEKFPDGTIYTSKSILDAKAKKVTVAVENSGYRKTGP